jgi:hypothetical protein
MFIWPSGAVLESPPGCTQHTASSLARANGARKKRLQKRRRVQKKRDACTHNFRSQLSGAARICYAGSHCATAEDVETNPKKEDSSKTSRHKLLLRQKLPKRSELQRGYSESTIPLKAEVRGKRRSRKSQEKRGRRKVEGH